MEVSYVSRFSVCFAMLRCLRGCKGNHNSLFVEFIMKTAFCFAAVVASTAAFAPAAKPAFT